VHLTPERISRAETLLERGGWGGIALGRAIPGVRYATVVACGLFKVPYPRFVTAHLSGSSVYVAVFLALGAAFGPTILDRVHLPALGVRLLWLLPLALGLPLRAIWWRRRAQPPIVQSRLRSVWATLFGSFAGTTALAATLSAAATTAELLGISHPLNVSYTLLGGLLGLGLDVDITLLLLYAVLLASLVGLGTAYYELALPHLAPAGGASPLWQTLGLALLALGLFGTILASAALVAREEPFEHWWKIGGPIALLGLVLEVAAYSVVTVNGRALAVSVVPTLRRDTPG